MSLGVGTSFLQCGEPVFEFSLQREMLTLSA